MDRTLKGSMEALTVYIRYHPDCSYRIESSSDDDEYILHIFDRKGGKRVCPKRKGCLVKKILEFIRLRPSEQRR